MKQAFVLMVILGALLQVGYVLLGYDIIAEIGYGAIVIMGLMISATFLWLYVMRATPLALGMAYSWSGASIVLGWWWVYALLGQPAAMTNSPLHFMPLALYLSGSVLHFSVIHRSFGLNGITFLWPVVGAVVLSTIIYLLT